MTFKPSSEGKPPSNNHKLMPNHSASQQARSYISKIKEMLFELDWEVLSHPMYSPDIAPFDFSIQIATRSI